MSEGTCPMGAVDVLETYFLENRARIIEVAAFLDRVDRAQEPEAGRNDPRYVALMRSIEELLGGGPGRAKRVQLAFSDPTSAPIESAAGMKGAKGAWMGGER